MSKAVKTVQGVSRAWLTIYRPVIFGHKTYICNTEFEHPCILACTQLRRQLGQPSQATRLTDVLPAAFGLFAATHGSIGVMFEVVLAWVIPWGLQHRQGCTGDRVCLAHVMPPRLRLNFCHKCKASVQASLAGMHTRYEEQIHLFA